MILADERFTRANLRAELERSAFNIVHVTSHADFSADVEGSFIQLADERLPLPDFLGDMRWPFIVLSALWLCGWYAAFLLTCAGFRNRAHARQR